MASALGPSTGAASRAVEIAGLSSEEAARRLRMQGPNELARARRRSAFRIAREVLSEPMFLMLFAAGAAYLLLGDLDEALLVVALATASIGITIVQETRSERTLDALRDLTSPRALVIRDGERKRIAGREVVEGDALILREGDRVPADARLVAASGLECDESLLTGESVPVRKRVGAETAAAPRPGGDDLPFAFSGTLVVRGQGIGIATATGLRSEIGKLGTSLATLEAEAPRLRRQTARLMRIFAVAGAAVSIAMALLYGLLREGWLEAVLAGIALNMALLPEEFPLVLTVFMVMGAWRISRTGMLTRRSAAIETLGSATVLCTDKTGTLTENRMAVAEVQGAAQVLGTGAADQAAQGRALLVGMLASEPEPYDPMEKAFHAAAAGSGEASAGAALVRQYPLSPDLLAMTHVWSRPDGSLLAAAKGAPEAVAGLCRLDEAARAAVQRAATEMAERGMRVLAVAEAAHAGVPPESQRAFAFRFAGLVGLADPLRPSVPQAVAECRGAGIRVVMITGDYPATAVAVARAAGIEAAGVLTGAASRRCRRRSSPGRCATPASSPASGPSRS
jgi:P-type Ca2+ transporter type 2C